MYLCLVIRYKRSPSGIPGGLAIAVIIRITTSQVKECYRVTSVLITVIPFENQVYNFSYEIQEGIKPVIEHLSMFGHLIDFNAA